MKADRRSFIFSSHTPVERAPEASAQDIILFDSGAFAWSHPLSDSERAVLCTEEATVLSLVILSDPMISARTLLKDEVSLQLRKYIWHNSPRELDFVDSLVFPFFLLLQLDQTCADPVPLRSKGRKGFRHCVGTFQNFAHTVQKIYARSNHASCTSNSCSKHATTETCSLAHDMQPISEYTRSCEPPI